MRNSLEAWGWVRKGFVAAILLLMTCGAALAAETEGETTRGRRRGQGGGASPRVVHRAKHKNHAKELGLTKQQRARLRAARKAAMEATKDIEDSKEHGKAIRDSMAAARDTILTEAQKAKFRELRANHKGRGKGNLGPGGKGRGKGNAGPGGKGRGKGIEGPGKHGSDIGGLGQGKGGEGPGRRGRRGRRATSENQTE